jgi:hypothetical protein
LKSNLGPFALVRPVGAAVSAIVITRLVRVIHAGGRDFLENLPTHNVIPAKAGTSVCFLRIENRSSRFRGNDTGRVAAAE